MFVKINVNLNKELREKYGVRSFPITKGDLVLVKSGKRKGEGGKISFVDHRSRGIQVEGLNIAKADGKEKQYLIRPEKLVITKLDITDERRLERLKEIAAIKHKDITAIEKEAVEQKKEAEALKFQNESESIQEAETISEEEPSGLSQNEEMDIVEENEEKEDAEEENAEDQVRKEEDSNDNQE
ncbi:MAG: 50S ribosomal protein L24 [Thermoplasmataceae archaeon]